MISQGGDEERGARGDGAQDRTGEERGAERLLAEEVDEDLTDLLFQDPPPPENYPER